MGERTMTEILTYILWILFFLTIRRLYKYIRIKPVTKRREPGKLKLIKTFKKEAFHARR